MVLMHYFEVKKNGSGCHFSLFIVFAFLFSVFFVVVVVFLLFFFLRFYYSQLIVQV